MYSPGARPAEPSLIRREHVAVGDGHELYLEERGNPAGIAVLLLHGGPGTGFRAFQSALYDAAFYRIILFDQRGCGRSRPLGSLAGNTTDALVADIESLRRHLGIDAWILSGGSWGTTLALAYAMRWPERCLALILRGVFLARPRECAWWFDVMRGFFPQAWRRFTAYVGTEAMEPIIERYLQRLCSGSDDERSQSALEWRNFQRACGSMLPPTLEWSAVDKPRTIASALLHAHYYKHRFFLDGGIDPSSLAGRLSMPCEIVHGRHDVVCPLETAFELSTHLPQSILQIVEGAGHALEDDGNWQAVMAASDRLKAAMPATGRD
jgi:proline iminopeptidase